MTDDNFSSLEVVCMRLDTTQIRLILSTPIGGLSHDAQLVFQARVVHNLPQVTTWFESMISSSHAAFVPLHPSVLVISNVMIQLCVCPTTSRLHAPVSVS